MEINDRVTGTGDGSTLTPQGQTARAETAAMLTRFCERCPAA